MRIVLVIFSVVLSTLASANYPDHWWNKVDDLASWEISPDSAIKGLEVVLSKRNELGILSNFAHTPFVLDGKKFESIEGLWQSMKYPDPFLKDDIRQNEAWEYSRKQVELMIGFEAKKAGDIGTKIMRKYDLNWVSYLGEKMVYRTDKKLRHYDIILAAMKAKLDQNLSVKKVLIQTCGLKLLADHHVKLTDPPAWRYYQIWQELRASLCR